MLSDKFEFSVIIPPVDTDEDLDQRIYQYVHEPLAQYLSKNLPVSITLDHTAGSVTRPAYKCSVSLFMIVEQQLNEYIEQQVKLALFTRAADNALNRLPDRVVN